MSWVYFITPEAAHVREEESLKRVKIGVTKYHPNLRLDALQIGSPVPLELLAYCDGDIGLERAFHETFAQLRFQREWFYLEGKLFDFLGYFLNRNINARWVSREELEISIADNIFARHSSHPRWSDQEYLATADPRHLRRLFPELWAEHCEPRWARPQ